jgi:hypothetical protein
MGGTFKKKSEPRPSAMVGCAKIASRTVGYRSFPGTAIRIAARSPRSFLDDNHRAAGAAIVLPRN